MQGLQKPCHPGSDQVRDLCRKTQGPETQELRPPENYGRGRINPEADLKARKPKPRVEPTPAEVEAKKQARRAYDQKRAQTPERKELQRRVGQARRTEAKSIGLCVTCWDPTIPGETMCETCAEQHPQYRRQAKERAAQQRDQPSGQASFF